MREILFRGKMPFSGEWVKGFYVHIPWGRGGADEHLIQTIKPDGRIDALFAVNPNTVGQYTGLTDKNGKKIFEGDILAGNSFVGGSYLCGYVEYGDFNCSCCDGVYGWYLTDGDIRLLQDPVALTVVGNKWDNPELLEVKT